MKTKSVHFHFHFQESPEMAQTVEQLVAKVAKLESDANAAEAREAARLALQVAAEKAQKERADALQTAFDALKAELEALKASNAAPIPDSLTEAVDRVDALMTADAVPPGQDPNLPPAPPADPIAQPPEQHIPNA